MNIYEHLLFAKIKQNHCETMTGYAISFSENYAKEEEKGTALTL